MRALQLHGCQVYATSAHRQRGPSGVTPGIPDLIVFRGRPQRFCFAEIKTPRGKPTMHQVAFMGAAHWAGVESYIWRSVDDALAWIEEGDE